jgi:hypothetical protein
MIFNVFNGLSTEDRSACVTIVGQVRVDHLGLSPEEQATRALQRAIIEYPEYPHPAVMPA